MNPAISRLNRDQFIPVGLISLFILLMPFSRASEISISLLCLTGVGLLVKHYAMLRSERWFRLLALLFIVVWLPMLISAFDSYDPGKSWYQTGMAIRLFFAALAIAWFCRDPKVREWVLRIATWSMLFWAVDAVFQLVVGFDLLGYPNIAERLNGPFGTKNLKMGLVLAFLSPLVYEHARRKWPGWVMALSFVLITVVVFLSGIRAAWLLTLLMLVFYLLLIIRHRHETAFRQLLILPASAAVLFVLAFAFSPIVQQRVSTTLELSGNSVAAWDSALSKRLPIWQTSTAIIESHPLNGVGIRAFPVAYPDFAEPDDPHIARMDNGRGASHAHNLILEIATDTGGFGLLSLLLIIGLAYRVWRQTSSIQHRRMLPFVFCLLLVYFPFNSHYAYYGAFMSSLGCWLVGLWLGALADTEPVES